MEQCSPFGAHISFKQTNMGRTYTYYDTVWFMPCVCHLSVPRLDGFAMYFIRPASIVPDSVNGLTYVEPLGWTVSLACIG